MLLWMKCNLPLGRRQQIVPFDQLLLVISIHFATRIRTQYLLIVRPRGDDKVATVLGFCETPYFPTLPGLLHSYLATWIAAHLAFVFGMGYEAELAARLFYAGMAIIQVQHCSAFVHLLAILSIMLVKIQRGG